MKLLARWMSCAAFVFAFSPALTAVAAPHDQRDQHYPRDQHGQRGPHPGARPDAWRGDIRHFHEHDYPRWRGGRWYHGPHDGRNGWWWVVGPTWYWYAAPVYPYPNPYLPPPVVAIMPPADIGPAVRPQYWYYCADPPGYYPYVPQCNVIWQMRPAAPP